MPNPEKYRIEITPLPQFVPDQSNPEDDRYVFAYTINIRNAGVETPGYGLTNLRGSYSWKQARVDFGVENLFDKLYGLPLGGAYVGQGTTMSATATPWGIAVPGMGRSFYLGLNYKF